jgi:regulator of protease activity HflC (stomatin/prohibitin superfamily)
MSHALHALNLEHAARQMQRMKTRAPVTLVGGLMFFASIGFAVLLGMANVAAGIVLGVLGVLVSIAWSLSAQLLAEWDRAVILRMGRFHGVRGPGFFMIVPVVEGVMRVVDMRVRTTSFVSESILTKDTVPVSVDAIAFWHVWDAQKAMLEVESYYQAIALGVQTALRDAVGVHTLGELLAEREKVASQIQRVLTEKTQAWGISVASIEIRDIVIPDNLKDALSRQAQAERERQARTTLGEAEREIAQKFIEASQGYQDNPVALQLRAMNMLYEGLRAGGSLIVVPSSVLDTMNLGGVMALANQAGRAKAAGRSAQSQGQ